jgi:hypothetical protein
VRSGASGGTGPPSAGAAQRRLHLDFDRLEKQAFRKFYDDGLVDVCFGLTMVGVSLGSVAHDVFGSEAVGLLVMAGLAAALVIVFSVTRRRVVTPRLGAFTPGRARRRRITTARLVLLGSAAAGVAAFGLGVVGSRQGAPHPVEVVLPVLWFVNAVVVMGAVAYFLDVPRFALYGVLFGLVGPLMIWPDVLWDVRLPPVAAFALPALPMVAIGSSKLHRFLRDHPVPETDLGDDGAR